MYCFVTSGVRPVELREHFAVRARAMRATFSETERFAGSRNEIRAAAAQYALSRIEHYFTQLPRRP